MGEVLMLPRRKKPVRKTRRKKVLEQAFDDPHLQAALMALYDNDKRLDRVASQTFKKIFKRLETLEGLVFAQSIIIAELRGQSLTPEQVRQIASMLRSKD